MMNHAAAVDALVVAATDDFPVANQNRADGNAAFGQTFPGFLNRGLEKNVHALRMNQTFELGEKVWRAQVVDIL